VCVHCFFFLCRFFHDSAAIFFSNNLLIDSDFGEDNPVPEPKREESNLEEFGELGSNGMNPSAYHLPMTEEEMINRAIMLSLM